MVHQLSADSFSILLMLISLIGTLSQNVTVPTSQPSYGPASSSTVNTIILSTLGGIILILAFYFYTGYFLYQSDVDGRLKKYDDEILSNQDSEISMDSKFSNERTPLLPEDSHIL